MSKLTIFINPWSKAIFLTVTGLSGESSLFSATVPRTALSKVRATFEAGGYPQTPRRAKPPLGSPVTKQPHRRDFLHLLHYTTRPIPRLTAEDTIYTIRRAVKKGSYSKVSFYEPYQCAASRSVRAGACLSGIALLTRKTIRNAVNALY